MPAPLAVDREAVKAHALMHGVRAAADHFGLKACTVMQWSAREKWLQPAREAATASTALLPPTIRPVSGVSKSPAEAAKTAMQTLANRSRLNGSIAAARAARHAKRLSPAAAFEQVDRLDKLASTLNKLHGSPDAGQPQPPIRLEVVAKSAISAEVIDVEWSAPALLPPATE